MGVGSSYFGNSQNAIKMDSDKKQLDENENEDKLIFEKKLAQFIPPKVKFKGNFSQRSLIIKRDFSPRYISNLTLFQNNILITIDSELQIYNKILKLIFSNKFGKNKDDILSLNPINNETISIACLYEVYIVNFYQRNNTITYEIIQKINDSNLYEVNKSLNNGYLILGGSDKKYSFYTKEKNNEQINANNKYVLVNQISIGHYLDYEYYPVVIDLNNGRILSNSSYDSNIKIIEYYPKQRIIKSIDDYMLFNARLISGKYVLLMGLDYPKYYSWLMDTETFEFVKKWETPDDDLIECVLGENLFLYSSSVRLAIDELNIEDGEFIRKTKYKFNLEKNEKFETITFLNRNTFIAINSKTQLRIYYCK